MKQYCGETLGDLEPVYDPITITREFTVPETVRTPPLREVHSTDETIVCRDLGDLELVYYKCNH